MSTKASIKYSQEEPGEPGFHLYDDVIHDLQGIENPPVYLQLSGVQVELQTKSSAGADVTVEIPRNLAIQLGLIKDPKHLDPNVPEHKPAVQKLMDLARRFRSAPGTSYDHVYTELQTACYEALREAAKS